MEKQLVIDFDRLDGIRKWYKVKAGDKIVRWVFTYNKGWVGKVTRSWRRSEGEVLSVDGDVINVRIEITNVGIIKPDNNYLALALKC